MAFSVFIPDAHELGLGVEFDPENHVVEVPHFPATTGNETAGLQSPDDCFAGDSLFGCHVPMPLKYCTP